jgi:hypothetical protein
MSEEQMDDWLDRPMDAEWHRFRKHSASWLDDSTDSEEGEKKIHVIEEHPEEDSVAEEDSFAYDSWKPASTYRQTWNTWYSTLETHGNNDNSDEDIAPDQVLEDAPATSEEVWPVQSAAKSRDSKLLSLPENVLQNIAFCVDPSDAKPFRLSCMKLYDMVPASLFSP